MTPFRFAAATSDQPAPLVWPVLTPNVPGNSPSRSFHVETLRPPPIAAVCSRTVSRTTGFRHPSIEAGIAAIQELGSENGFAVDHTEDPAVFSGASLAGYRVIVFLSTTGDPISDPDQRAALEDFVHRGGGYVGIHAASDQNDDSRTTWPWYGHLLGAYFGGRVDLNRLVTLNRTILDSPRVFAGILAILVLSIAYYMLARALESRMVVWQSVGKQTRSASRDTQAAVPAPAAA